MPERVNLVILDRSVLFVKTLKNYFSDKAPVITVIQSPDKDHLSAQLKQYPVDVLLIDIQMPDVVDIVCTVRREYAMIKVLLLGMYTDMKYMAALLDLGIYGVISKADDPEDLFRAVISVKDHHVYRNKLFTDLLYERTLKEGSRGKTEHMISLNDREKRLLQLLWEEKSNKEIAQSLYISVRTVEKAKQTIKDKLGIKSTVGILKYAIKNKIISSGLVFQED